MNVRSISSTRRSLEPVVPEKAKFKWRFFGLLALALILFGLFSLGHSHASAEGDTIKVGYSGYCLDNYRSGDVPGNRVDIWGCNGSDAQSWDANLTQIKKTNNLCLTADSVTSLTISSCSQSPKQIWLEDADELYSPHFGLCLTASSASDGAALTLQSCNNSNKMSQNFRPSVDLENTPCTGTQGQLVACYSVKEWIKWQASPNQRVTYLTSYTDGTPYEEWCADFVSYIYKEAGYPFSGGEANGWDENLAPNIQNQGFTIHQAGSYIPKAGDVAYFDYPGGHVEIVIAGGSNPTFIYGDSDTIDPIISNGAMASNDILSINNFGSVQYYMSPNSST